jgi:2'-5' RNA ligase
VNALVSLLDHDHAEEVRSIEWELESRFGVTSQYVKPFIHFSYHVVADEYDLDHLGPALDDLSASRAPFQVPTTGVGVFTGSQPVIFVGVTRTPELDSLHQMLWDTCTPGFGVGLPYYAPEAWSPHVTIARGTRAGEHLPEILEYLGEHDLTWKLNVDNLAVIEDGGQERGLIHQVALQG